MAKLNNFSASGVTSDARKKPVVRRDADGDCIEPAETEACKQAAKRCVAILQDAWATDNGKRIYCWRSDAELRRAAVLDDYCLRNWDSILGLLGEFIEIRHGARTQYKYSPARVLETKNWNNTDVLNPEGRKASWSIKADLGL